MERPGGLPVRLGYADDEENIFDEPLLKDPIIGKVISYKGEGFVEISIDDPVVFGKYLGSSRPVGAGLWEGELDEENKTCEIKEVLSFHVTTEENLLRERKVTTSGKLD